MSVAVLRETLTAEQSEVEKAKQRIELLAQQPLPTIGRDSMRRTDAVIQALSTLKSEQYKLVLNES